MTDMTNRPEPAGENTVNGFIAVDGATAFIDFLTAVFDAVEDLEAHTPDFYAGDGTLIHAEVTIGNSRILITDRKADWPFTPALTQVYVNDAHETLRRASDRGATVITEVSPFYGQYDIARFLDPWHNVWWLFAPAADVAASSTEFDEASWDETAEPDAVYTTVLDAMRALSDPRTHHGERPIRSHPADAPDPT